MINTQQANTNHIHKALWQKLLNCPGGQTWYCNYKTSEEEGILQNTIIKEHHYKIKGIAHFKLLTRSMLCIEFVFLNHKYLRFVKRCISEQLIIEEFKKRHKFTCHELHNVEADQIEKNFLGRGNLIRMKLCYPSISDYIFMAEIYPQFNLFMCLCIVCVCSQLCVVNVVVSVVLPSHSAGRGMGGGG